MQFEKRLQDRGRWKPDACSAAKVLDLLSTKTSFLVVRECFYGTTRFEDFVDRVGASAPAISRALKQLESAGIISRLPYREPGQRARDEYRLTAAGEDLLPVFLALVQWGDTHLQNGRGPLAFVDADSGREVRVCVTPDGDRAPSRSSDIQIRANAQREGA
ncbi:winged helix-turn-helix transcriptional regulator [Mycobacterium heckeshornense]|uniref:Putative transcriptional regulator n=1 Tax=Mycobacterium heckeshornense TaxID=110505 RepID=A0A2I3EIF2_9MYCO|nr:helix-turn-helix domain-containing protein [Mycobacterium heckeshornense]KMV20766.1 transcriptional regulator [Mycobacterium heckeshornense]BCO37455.1 putative transcriptional regulator [Mycobacterium heckeshornense]